MINSKNILSNLRSAINIIDKEILFLLSYRNRIIKKIAKKKIVNNLPIQDLNRENEIFTKLTKIGKQYYLQSEYIKKIFKIIINDSVKTQNLIKKQANSYIHKKIISFLGPKGSYSYIATKKYINKNFDTYKMKECLNFQEIFYNLKNKISNYAIIPIKNKYSGFIKPILPLLKNFELYIIGEFKLSINHCILAKKNIHLISIKKIYSHAQPFYQCSTFIKKFPNWNIKYTNSTSEAMQIVSSNKNDKIASIGSIINSKIYKLKILKKNISNIKNNFTKFIILKNKKTKSYQLKNKITVLILTTQYIPLNFIISIFQKHQIHILETETFFDNFKYIQNIYIKVLENINSKNMQQTLQELYNKNIIVKILGSYTTIKI